MKTIKELEKDIKEKLDTLLNPPALKADLEETGYTWRDTEILARLEDKETLLIDGFVYEIINGYHGYGGLYEKVHNIFTEWAKEAKGKNAYYEFFNASILHLAA